MHNILEYGLYMGINFYFLYTLIKPANPQNPMGMSMGANFQYPMGMGTGMGVIFENGYGCGYTATRPKPAPLPFLNLSGIARNGWLLLQPYECVEDNAYNI